MTGLLVTIVIGFVVGAVARFIMPGKQDMGWIATILLGIIGSVGATYAGQAIGWYQAGQGAGWIGSIIGALILLFIYQRVKARG